MSLNNLLNADYAEILSGSPLTIDRFKQLIDSIIKLTDVLEGSGAPTIQAEKHAWYFDTASNRYYRNIDGGTTWIALN